MILFVFLAIYCPCKLFCKICVRVIETNVRKIPNVEFWKIINEGLLCFDLLTRPKMPFKVVHRNEVTHPGRWKSEEVAQALRRVYITAWEFEGNIRPMNWGQLEEARRRASSTVEGGGRRVVVGKASTQKSLLQGPVEQPWRTRKTQRWRP